MCHTRLNGGTVERHASVQARTHAAAVRHRPRDLVSTLFMVRFHRTAFVSLLLENLNVNRETFSHNSKIQYKSRLRRVRVALLQPGRLNLK